MDYTEEFNSDTKNPRRLSDITINEMYLELLNFGQDSAEFDHDVYLGTGVRVPSDECWEIEEI